MRGTLRCSEKGAAGDVVAADGSWRSGGTDQVEDVVEGGEEVAGHFEGVEFVEGREVFDARDEVVGEVERAELDQLAEPFDLADGIVLEKEAAQVGHVPDVGYFCD